ncbi:MAG TPA: helix-turn-helix transcriptional regulator [Thermoleophilaceae bacterium]
MPARRDEQSRQETRLAVARVFREVTQADLAEAIGISLTAYRALERGQTQNPPLRWLVNAGIALGIDWEELVDDDWREWLPLNERRAKPPRRDGLWHTAPWSEVGQSAEWGGRDAEQAALGKLLAERARRRRRRSSG